MTESEPVVQAAPLYANVANYGQGGPRKRSDTTTTYDMATCSMCGCFIVYCCCDIGGAPKPPPLLRLAAAAAAAPSGSGGLGTATGGAGGGFSTLGAYGAPQQQAYGQPAQQAGKGWCTRYSFPFSNIRCGCVGVWVCTWGVCACCCAHRCVCLSLVMVL